MDGEVIGPEDAPHEAARGDESAAAPWQRALTWVLTLELMPGAIVRTRELYAAMGFEPPTPRTPYGVAERVRLEFMRQFGRLREALLEQHKVDLRTRAGTGYEVIAPDEQSRLALADGQREIGKAIADAARRVEHVRVDSLDDRARTERSNAQAKLAQLRAMHDMSRRRGRR